MTLFGPSLASVPNRFVWAVVRASDLLATPTPIVLIQLCLDVVSHSALQGDARESFGPTGGLSGFSVCFPDSNRGFPAPSLKRQPLVQLWLLWFLALLLRYLVKPQPLRVVRSRLHEGRLEAGSRRGT